MPRRVVARDQWDHFVEHHEHGWFFHTSRWIEYALAYAPGAVDESYAMVDGHDLVGVVPGVVGPDGVASYGGQPIPAPLAAHGYVLAVGGCTKPILIAGRPGQVDEDEVAPDGMMLDSWDTSVVDLTKTERELRAGLRKSYRNLINQAEARACVSVYGHAEVVADEHPIEAARKLHVLSCGRETRSRHTWELMGRWMQEGDAVLALATVGGEPKAYAYALRWKDWSYYASGASVEQNLSHALIWQLMRALMYDGRTRHFEVGWLAKDGDGDKDRGISFFKEGFGGTPWTIHAMRRR